MRLIRPTIHPCNLDASESYDILLAALGYEQRGTSVAARLAGRFECGMAVGFGAKQELSFTENQSWFSNHGFSVHSVPDEQFASWLSNEFSTHLRAASTSRQIRIAVDISSFSRFRLAVVVNFLRHHDCPVAICVDFHYTLAEFSPPAQSDAPNEFVGPVLPAFAGWTEEPEEPVTAIIGLGFEYDRALGAVEHIEGSEIWLLKPTSPILEYSEALSDANHLLESGLEEQQVLSYPVLDPMYSFTVLESLVSRRLLSGGCMIFPFGPKMFSALSFLVGCVHPDVAVWRVSPGKHAPAEQRVSSAYHTSIRAVFDPESTVDWSAKAVAAVAWH